MQAPQSSRAHELGQKVVYQIYVRSFNDSNGDGIGDLAGITQRLDYLAGLGVDYIWLTPFFVSPQNDNGYDVADYRSVEPMFGTMDDFDELSREAAARGIGIMLDMVFNHTSTEHEWFRRALAGDPKYLAYYKFVDAAPGATAEDPGEPPTNWVSKFGGPAWAYVPELNKWYLHLFDPTQADLDWDNPEVRAELEDVVHFWKAKGVSGFRFDVVNLISKPATWENDNEGDGRRFYTDGPHVHEYLQELVREGGIDGMMTVGEMSSTSLENCIRYTNPACHELSMAFNFHHLKVDYANGEKWALAPVDLAELRRLFKEWQEGMTAGGGWNALFWSNHDQPRPNSRFGDVDNYWYETTTALAACTHLMRGTPYIYQGEELGMTNPGFTSIDQYRDVESINYYQILQDEGKTPEGAFHIVAERSRDDSRTPVQWTAGPNAGFTTGTPWIGVADNYTTINAEAEVADPHSPYAFFKRLIELRKTETVIAEGDVAFVEADPLTKSDGVIAYLRTLDDTRLLVAVNLTGHEAEPFEAEVADGTELLIGNYADAPHTDKGRLVLRPYEVVALIRR